MRSSAENVNFKNTLNLHFLTIGYFGHFENTEKFEGLYSDLMASVITTGLFRNINGDAFKYDDTYSKAFGVGAEFQVKTGYTIKFSEHHAISPFIVFGITPYLFSPNTEAVINQTKELASKNWTSILSGQVGLAFHFYQR